uniref:CSON001305 protein n=1 Tax=Culicoides sonorensis TaxID=179676 RepID=A0A336LHP8_CULSO
MYNFYREMKGYKKATILGPLYTSHILLISLTYLEYFNSLSSLVSFSESAKILCFFSTPSKSGILLTQPLMVELANRGHEVTVVSSFALDKEVPNYRDIVIPLGDEARELTKTITSKEKSHNMITWLPKLLGVSHETTNNTLNHPKFKALLDEEFDLIVFGYFLNNFQLGLATHFKCPSVLVSPAPLLHFLSESIGHPSNPEAMKSMFLSREQTPMALWERVLNMIVFGFENLVHTFIEYKANQYFTTNFPNMSYSDAKESISLVLVNQHTSEGVIRPLLPNVIEIGGLQIKNNPSPLPNDIKEWIEDGKDGVILVSFGTNFRSADLQQGKLNILLNSFKKIKQRIIWKFENESVANLPENVLIKKWLPQDDILAHPNTKAFVSHCGLSSYNEALFHGVPIVAVPFVSDQPWNAERAQKGGWAIVIPFLQITEKSLVEAVQEIIKNETYTKAVQKLSLLYRDRPITAMENAVYWIEYVIRHKGAQHLRYSGKNLNFIQEKSWDVLILKFCVFKLFLLMLLFYLIFLTTVFFPDSESAKILCFYPTPSKSGVLISQPLMVELANRGHEVTVVSSFPLPYTVKNYRDIEIPLGPEIREERLVEAVEEIIRNKTYTKAVQKLSLLYRDRPITAMENAVYWIEYVIRHKGAHHLRYAGQKLNFIQEKSWDVILKFCVFKLLLLCSSNKKYAFILLDIFNYGFFPDSESAKILCFYPTPSKSGVLISQPLMVELANRGHEVTVVSSFPLPYTVKNYRDIEIPLGPEIRELTKLITTKERGHKILTWFPKVMRMCHLITNYTLNHDNFKFLLDEEFDLVVFGYIFNNFQLGLANHFKCPSVMLSSIGFIHFLSELVGHPSNPEAIKSILVGRDETPMAFWERLLNMMVFGVENLLNYYVEYSSQKYFEWVFLDILYNFPGKSYTEAKETVAFVMANQYSSEGWIRPLLPNVIEIGGLQIKNNPSPLPMDIKEWIEGSKDGVILVSFGTNFMSADLQEEKLNILVSSFRKIKQRIIWKYENETVENLPENVLIKKWLPQDDILAHSNTKAFISHCGLSSYNEALFHGVPVVAVPMVSDQPWNSERARKSGWAIVIPFLEITEIKLVEAVQEIIKNETYTKAVQKLSLLYRDRPITAMENAVYWIEYVIRHKGAHHLRYSGQKLNFIQEKSWDVLVILLIVCYLIFKFLKFCVFKLMSSYQPRKNVNEFDVIKNGIPKKNL